MGQGNEPSHVLEFGNLCIDKQALKKHVMRTENVKGVLSDPHYRPIPERQTYDFKFTTGLFYEFDAQGFANGLDAALADKVAGYAARLQRRNSVLFDLVSNWARIPYDGSEAWASSVRMHVASCSKLITAIAMTKILNEKQISYDTPVIGFLPDYWLKGPNIDKITFRHLMTHTSGFNNGTNSASDFQWMRQCVALGVPGVGAYKYENVNFGLCRILLPTVLGELPTSFLPSHPVSVFWEPSVFDLSDDQWWDYLTIQSYVQYVHSYIFAPAGVSGPTLDHPDSDALAYNFPVLGLGWNSGDLTEMTAAAGWHFSPAEMLRIMGTFRRHGTIMTTLQAQDMLDDGFGIDDLGFTPLGPFYRKKGYWHQYLGGVDYVEQSLAYFLPWDMELVVLVNSPVGPAGENVEDLVEAALMANIRFKSVPLHSTPIPLSP